MTMTLTLPYPPSINTYWRHVGPRVLISANGRRYRRAVGDAVLLGISAGQIAKEPLPGRLAVLVEAAPPDRRARDLDNTLKALLDALTHAGVWLDDSQIDDLRIVRCPHMRGGQVTVTVTPMPVGNAWQEAA